MMLVISVTSPPMSPRPIAQGAGEAHREHAVADHELAGRVALEVETEHLIAGKAGHDGHRTALKHGAGKITKRPSSHANGARHCRCRKEEFGIPTIKPSAFA